MLLLSGELGKVSYHFLDRFTLKFVIIVLREAEKVGSANTSPPPPPPLIEDGNNKWYTPKTTHSLSLCPNRKSL